MANSGKKAEVIFRPYEKRIRIAFGKTLMDAAKVLGVDLTSICGSRGICGKCKVKIESNMDTVGELTPCELKHLSKDEISESYRLACQTRILGNVIVSVPERSRMGKQRLQTEGLEVPVAPYPMVKKYFVKLRKASIEDPRSDESRLLEALKTQYKLDKLKLSYEAALQIPFVLRENNWRCTVVVWNEEKIIAIEPADTTSRCYGFAVDIGTTKLAGFLIDLNTGKVLAVSARLNPQIPYGEDVMSRITYAMKGSNQLEELQKAVVSGINEMIRECCEKVGVKPDEIYESVFVGNTCMHHLFLKIWPKHVALSPYPPVITRGMDVQASKIQGLNLNPNGNIYVAPTIGGFVGADSVADIMVAKMLDSKEVIFNIDIGTNTEIAIGNENGVLICSCASGPAFEGMHITHGMRASTGAIERISVDPETLEVSYITIDDVKPIGICGSGLIDALAALLKAGIINTRGRFVKEMMTKTDRLRLGAHGLEFIIATKEETNSSYDISITENDVEELLKAKAAMHAGASILMKKMSVAEDDVAQVVIAGAFGNYVDPESARTIGMYPEFSLQKVKFIGNSAGTGARMMLVSKSAREYAQEIVEKCRYHEIAIDPDFAIEYAKSMYLPYKDLDRFPITRELLQRLGHYSLAGRETDNGNWLTH
ncbi:MAG: ASKHA domain-containing protein [Candidatus Bathyarchaeia archaeon]